MSDAAPQASGSVPLIRLRNIVKVYGEGGLAFKALKGFDLDIEQGDFVAIMGPSGSGKSTAMNTLGCSDRPTSGEYLFKGVHVEDLDRDERARLRRRYYRVCVPGVSPAATHHAHRKTWSCRCCTVERPTQRVAKRLPRLWRPWA